MKYLLLFLLTTNTASALECGKTNQSIHTVKLEVDAQTDVPKFLRGATITITQANGKTETVKAEEFMVVKRKHKRPVLSTVVFKTTLKCSDISKKNIISGKLVDGYSDVSTNVTGKSAKISLDRQLGVGLQYQRQVADKLFLGVGADSNRGAEALLGFGF